MFLPNKYINSYLLWEESNAPKFGIGLLGVAFFMQESVASKQFMLVNINLKTNCSDYVDNKSVFKKTCKKNLRSICLQNKKKKV